MTPIRRCPPSVLLLFASALSAGAIEPGEKPDTPQLPGVPYVVHDGTRPQPRVVATGGAVTVAPPSDATVLFDGSGLDAWQGGWKVVDGAMVASPGDLVTKQSFGAVQGHVEWRIPAGRAVKGQTGGNSGIFLMGRYEIQVLQSHDNPTYPDGQAASMYGQLPPLVNATAPQGEWQSYDFVFHPPHYEGGELKRPATLTLFHNGVVVQDGEAYLGPTEHKTLASYPQDHPASGPIRLQWHGDPIEFRNLWVRPIGERDQQAPAE